MNAFRAFIAKNWVTITVTVITPLVFWFFVQREGRRLDVILHANLPVVALEPELSDIVSVTYNDQQLSSLNIVEIRVANSGNRSIRSADFDRALSFKFSGRVLGDPKLLKTEPPNLSPQLTARHPDTINVTPLLLNKGDYFSFQILAADLCSNAPVNIDARISGIPIVKLRDNGDTEYSRNTLLMVIAAASGAVVVSFSVRQLLRQALRAFQIRTAFGTLEVEFAPTASAEGISVAGLADALGIPRHDVKANLMLLRLKIEEQLRILARNGNLGSRYERRSMTALTAELEKRELLPHGLAGLIRDVAPLINRELHEIEGYLSEEELQAIQTASLQIIAGLNASAQSV